MSVEILYLGNLQMAEVENIITTVIKAKAPVK